MNDHGEERPAQHGRVAALGAVLLVTIVALVAGFVLKDRCVGSVVPNPRPYDGTQFRQSCYSDIYVLYFARGLDDQPMPYIHGDGVLDNEHNPDGSTTEIGDLEYPAGTGLVVGAIASQVHDAVAFFGFTSILLALAGAGAVLLVALIARAPRRIYYFAAAPSVVLYAFHNWDLIAVLFVCAALYAFHERADTTAGVMLGLGAACKVFPGLLLPAFVLARWRNERRFPVGMVAGSLVAFAVVNVPLAIMDRAGWWLPWKFQSTRFPNYETSWFFLHKHLGSHAPSFDTFGRWSGYLSGALFVAAAMFLLYRESKRATFRPVVTAFGLLLIFLLTSKVFSPQYALWVLPFFVLVEIPWPGFAAFAIAEAAVWFAISAFFLAAGQQSQDFRLFITEVAVFARYVVLGWLLYLSRRSEDLVRRTTALA